VFNTFAIYIIILAGIGIPLLTFIGYIHFKRTPSYSSESAINKERKMKKKLVSLKQV
jgi:hypothetical protein